MPSRNRRPSPAPAIPDYDDLVMEVMALRQRDEEQRYEIATLKEERAILSGRLDNLEDGIRRASAALTGLITKPMMFARYAEGILHAVPVPRPAPVNEPAPVRPPRPRRPAPAPAPAPTPPDDLPNPADRIYAALAGASGPSPLPELAALVKLSPTGGHFRRGLTTLKERGLLEVDAAGGRLVGTPAR